MVTGQLQANKGPFGKLGHSLKNEISGHCHLINWFYDAASVYFIKICDFINRIMISF